MSQGEQVMVSRFRPLNFHSNLERPAIARCAGCGCALGGDSPSQDNAERLCCSERCADISNARMRP